VTGETQGRSRTPLNAVTAREISANLAATNETSM
jgi:hypothetical protein